MYKRQVLTVTLAAAAAAAIVNLWLSIRAGQVRHQAGVSIGDGGNELLVRRMRAHANFIENAPLVLILIAAIELDRPDTQWLAWVAAAFILGRVAHGFGMDGGAMAKGRMIGTLITMLTLLGLAAVAVLVVLRVM